MDLLSDKTFTLTCLQNSREKEAKKVTVHFKESVKEHSTTICPQGQLLPSVQLSIEYHSLMSCGADTVLMRSETAVKSVLEESHHR